MMKSGRFEKLSNHAGLDVRRSGMKAYKKTFGQIPTMKPLE